MKVLFSFLALYRRYPYALMGGLLVAIVSVLATVALFSLAGWLLSATFIAGISGTAATFNYLLPAAAIRFLALIRTAGRYSERVLTHDATLRLLAELRTATFSRIIPLVPAGIQCYRQGELLNRLVSDIDTLDHLYLRLMVPLLCAGSAALSVTIGLGSLDYRLALTLGGVLFALLLLYPPLGYWVGRRGSQGLGHWQAQSRLQIVEWLQGQAELESCGASARWRRQIEEALQSWQSCQQCQQLLIRLAQALLSLVGAAALLLMLGLALHCSLSGAWIAWVVFITLAVFDSFIPVAGAFQPWVQIAEAAQRIQQLLEQPPAVEFSTQTVSIIEPLTVTLEQVSFTHPGRWQPTLQSISLTIQPGEKWVLLGHSGSGKSTLWQLITGCWAPTQGSIRFNQHLLTDCSEAQLREWITVVPQQITIFSATLADNLRLAAPGATDEACIQVLHQVNLGHLVTEQGLALWLGDGGRPLSGGEQRRLGIARAFLRPAQLLVLDEPAEGLDPYTEQQIIQQLWEHVQGKSLLWITHRPPDLARFDGRMILEAGRVIEQ